MRKMTSRQNRNSRFLQLIVFLAITSLVFFTSARAADNSFIVDDYFKLKRVTELSLSSDGSMVAFVSQSQSLDKNTASRTVFVSETSPGAEQKIIDELQGGRSFSWIPGTHKLAYLKTNGDTTELMSYDMTLGKTHRHFGEDEFVLGGKRILTYQFSPDGERVALSTTKSAGTEEGVSYYDRLQEDVSIYDRLHHGDTGVILDSETTWYAHFVRPGLRDFGNPSIPTSNISIIKAGSTIKVLEIPGVVESIDWSSDGSKLSLTYFGTFTYDNGANSTIRQMAVYNFSTNDFQALFQPYPKDKSDPMAYYSAGPWLPNTNKMIVSKFVWRNLAFDRHEWAIVDFAKTEEFSSKDVQWQKYAFPTGNAYLPYEFIPTNDGRIYAETTIRAQRSLYDMTDGDPRRASIVEEIDGAISHFQFNRTFNTAVFVNESPTRPPEIFVWRRGEDVRQQTKLNPEISNKAFAEVQEVHWMASDGEEIQGWLLLPKVRKSEDYAFPTLTFVKGGPESVISNEFASYFSVWPYPFEAIADAGIAVFLPNYRGSTTFGADFISQGRIHDGLPSEDIIKGVQHLIEVGIADPNRLAIAGQSHGAWLAPLVMTREKVFQAGSFAEGKQNRMLVYMFTPDSLNRTTHDRLYGNGESLYDNPQRYIELSPDMNFKGLSTAALFEAGVQGSAAITMGSPKSARRAGMPTEFVAYPQTGHNPTLPGIKKEIAVRNLDWFRFWLQGFEDPAPEKTDQFARWRKMRDKRCAQYDHEDKRATYCEYSTIQ